MLKRVLISDGVSVLLTLRAAKSRVRETCATLALSLRSSPSLWKGPSVNPSKLLACATLVLLFGCMDDSVARLEEEGGSASTSAKELLSPSGPDISIDQARLQASIRVLANQTVTQAEVEEGCASARTGRTLIRFDVRTPNNGPADLKFGSVSCRSTNPSASCAGVACSANPGCCCGGQNTCTAPLNPEAGKYFDFSCAHGHIHFKSFAQYRLLTATGTVAAQGHKQSFCLMDLDTSPATCRNPKFDCGNQGISAGCADVYASNLACSFVDATGIPQGDYTLEVTMDPLDAINESNESNNRQTALVRVPFGPVAPPPVPVDAGAPVYLVRDGLGSNAEANGYYGLNIPNFAPDAYTFTQWKTDFIGARPLVKALYRNKNELGFWREMNCTQTVGRGVGGCWVTNWDDVDDSQRGVPDRGTVGMNISAAGVTRFYVFTPAGLLSTSAVLDSEGPKFVPQLCTTCHSGEYRGVSGGSDLGSIWREFEASQLQPRPGLTPAQADAEWFALNQVIKQANLSVHSEAEGAPFGTNHATAAQAAYLDSMYLTTQPPVSRPVDDAFHLPPTWLTGANSVQIAAKANVWKKVVAPYCMVCHRTNSVDFSNYSQWQLVAAQQGGVPLLRRYIQVDPTDPFRQQLPFMPQAKVSHQNLLNDATAQIAINEWLGDASNRPPVANAGPASRAVRQGDTVTLSGALSTDPEGDALTFQWDVVTGPQVTFVPSATAREVSFVVPNVTTSTTLVLRLLVKDARLSASEAQVLITINPAQGPRLEVAAVNLPRAIPDNSATGILSTIDVTDSKTITDLKVSVDITHPFIGDLLVTLRGPNGLTRVLHNRAGRDADDIVQTYVVSEAAGALTPGRWTLAVADLGIADTGRLNGFKLDFGVSATPPAPTPVNHAPLANAGPDLTAAARSVMAVDGSGSSDPEGDALTFSWEQLSGPLVSLSGAPSSRVSFIAPVVTATTFIELKLTVRDGRGGVATDSTRIAVDPAAPAGRVLISEVMVNPSSTDSTREWVKVWNGTANSIDLSQFSLAFGGNTVWGNVEGGRGGVLQLRGLLPPGKCILVGGPGSDSNNANPLFAPSANFGLGQAEAFSGLGLQNPSTEPDAIGLFNLPAARVNASARPVDVVVYRMLSTTSPAPSFIGPTGGPAPVNVISGTDGASGRSFRRLTTAVWEISSGAAGETNGTAPSPNNCSAINP